MVDQGEGMAVAQIAEGPVLEGYALDLHVDDAGDPVLIGGIGSLGARMLLGPGGEVLAQPPISSPRLGAPWW